jgi:predicted NBD/HSP70 family sugar kinase
VVAARDDDEERPRQSGRPPVPIALVPRAAFAVGLDIGHDHVRAAVCDLSGEILGDEYEAAEVDHAPIETLDLAERLVRAALERADVPRDRVIGMGMGLAAPVDPSRGLVFAEGIMPSWVGVQPAAELAARLGLPVRLENDANLGAVGEQVFGAGRESDDMVYVRVSAGIGLGMVLRGRPYGGGIGIAGELGHVRVAPEGLICRCGNRGCLETVASPPAVAALLARSRNEEVSVERLLELVERGDRGAVRAVAEAGKSVGEAIATVVTLLNPTLVVIGGELARAGDALLAPVRTAIAEYSVPPAAAAVRVVPGTLGERAEVLGAAALILAQSPQALVQRLAER